MKSRRRSQSAGCAGCLVTAVIVIAALVVAGAALSFGWSLFS